MSDAYYTYRIQIANKQNVRVTRTGSDGKSHGQGNGRFDYEAATSDALNEMLELAANNKLRGKAQVQKLGEFLFNVLFDDVLRHDFVNYYDQAVRKNDKLLRVELDIDEELLPEIAALPWEFMRVPASANLGIIWLGTAPDIIFSRRRSQWFVPNPIQLEAGQKLRIAVAIAEPENLGPIKYDKVLLALEKLIADQKDRIELLPVVNPATPESIDEILSKEPHIFQFTGHGRLENEDGEPVGEIALVDDMDEAMWVDADYFSELLNQHQPGIVLLQACEGGMSAASEAFVGVASHVVEQNIPVVVAMQYEVSNTTAGRFIRRFYQQLAKDDPVDRAAQYGRRSIALGPLQYKSRDFATPVLFMRVEDGHLFQREGGAVVQEDNEPIGNGAAMEPVEEDGQAAQNIPPAPATLTLPQVASLGRQISEYFDTDQLRDFCLDLGIDYENLRGSSKGSKARELADYCRRMGMVPQLWEHLHEQRPHVQWKL